MQIVMQEVNIYFIFLDLQPALSNRVRVTCTVLQQRGDCISTKFSVHFCLKVRELFSLNNRKVDLKEASGGYLV